MSERFYNSLTIDASFRTASETSGTPLEVGPNPAWIRVGGMTVVARLGTQLARLGARDWTLVVDEPDAARARALLRDPRLQSESLGRDTRVRVRNPDLTDEPANGALVLRANAVYHPDALAAILGLADTGSKDAWTVRLQGPDDVREAERRLLDDCRKEIDGPGDRYLNRHLSRVIVRCIWGTRITPNAVSMVTFLVAALAAWFAMTPDYWSLLLAACLMQANSILDCVDGDLARVRLQQSKLGQWLDTVSDDVANILFFAGLAYGASQLPHGGYLAVAGIVACIGQWMMCLICYPELIAVGSGDLLSLQWDFDQRPDASRFNRVLAFLRWCVKKDFFILAFVALAALGVLPWALAFSAVGAVASVAVAIVRLVKLRATGWGLRKGLSCRSTTPA